MALRACCSANLLTVRGFLKGIDCGNNAGQVSGQKRENLHLLWQTGFQIGHVNRYVQWCIGTVTARDYICGGFGFVAAANDNRHHGQSLFDIIEG